MCTQAQLLVKTGKEQPFTRFTNLYDRIQNVSDDIRNINELPKK